MPTNTDIQKRHSSKHGGVEEMDCSLNTLLNQARADTLSLAIARMKATKSNMCLRDRIILLDDIELLEKELKRLTK